MKALLATILLGLTACATVPRAESDPPTVRLQFDWAPGSEANVRAVRTAVDESPRGRFVDETTMQYRLRVDGSGEGVLLRWADPEVESLPQRWIPRTVEMVALEIGQVDFQVNRLGNFVEVREPIEAQTRVAGWAAHTLPRDPRPPGVHARLIELFSEDAIARRTEAFWGHLVGVWNGGTMEFGRSYTARDEVRVPGLGGIPVQMEVQIAARSWVPCEEGDRDAACVRLALTARPAEEQRPLLMEFSSAFFAADPSRELRIEHDVEVVTDPRNLRPRAMRATEVVEIPLAGGETILIEDERLLVFDWAP